MAKESFSVRCLFRLPARDDMSKKYLYEKQENAY